MSSYICYRPKGVSARAIGLEAEEADFVRTLDLLSYKPTIYAVNVFEDDAASEDTKDIEAVKKFAAAEGAGAIVICALDFLNSLILGGQ